MPPKWRELGDEYPGVSIQVAEVRGRPRIVAIKIEDAEGVVHDAIRRVPVAQIEASLAEQQATGRRDAVARPESIRVGFTVPSPPTRRELHIEKRHFRNPGGRGYAPELYQRVAKLYRRCVAARVQPAPAIAEANDVPVSTVHRWIREARRRGVLLSARKKGAAG
jgi:hypothetical protein